jgi:cytochrome c-type biogenesis protein CcmH/NrfF
MLIDIIQLDFFFVQPGLSNKMALLWVIVILLVVLNGLQLAQYGRVVECCHTSLARFFRILARRSATIR